jgi:hypothetical protein
LRPKLAYGPLISCPEPSWPARNQDRASALHRLPSRRQIEPEGSVAVVPRCRGKAAAFVDAPLEFVVGAGPNDLEGEISNGGVLKSGVLNDGVSVEHGAGSIRMSNGLFAGAVMALPR